MRRSPSRASTTCWSAPRSSKEYARINADYDYGNTIWSPLASGLLTGKYRDGVPEGSRGALPGYEWLLGRLTDAEVIQRVERLRPIADRLGCTMAQLAIAWCTLNTHVSSVITGASRVEQVRDNFGALDVIPALTAEVAEEIDAALGV